MNKKPIVAGNWKMNKHPEEGFSFVNDIQDLLLDINHVSVIFAPPFTGLFEMNVNPPFYSAAQNCHWENSGAFTGEISVSMIKNCGAKYVIIGHSERRQFFNESTETRSKKKSDFKSRTIRHCREGIRTKSHGRYCPIIQTFKGRHILVLQIKERSIFVISGSLGKKL